MKKIVCLVLGVLCALSVCGCGNEDTDAPRIWCIKPSSASSETEVRNLIRHFDSDAYLSFVEPKELSSRLTNAMEKGEAPDVFMMYADCLPDLAQDKKLLDVTDRVRVGKIESDKLADGARRACIYSGRTFGVPLFSDVYMLATNREVFSVPPDSVEQLVSRVAELKEKGVKAIDKISPDKKELLFEAALGENGGKMLNFSETKLAFASPEGERALSSCKDIFAEEADAELAIGEGKAAFSVMTTSERREISEKFPDAEITLSPLFGLNRLQTVALSINSQTGNQARSYRLLEFLAKKSEELAALYKYYPASKELSPVSGDDESAVVTLGEARPAPSLGGYRSVLSVYIPAAIDKAGKGVNLADCLDEAVQNGNIA